MLKNIWGIVWRPLQFHMQKSAKVIGIAMKLQNYVIDFDKYIFKAKRSAYEQLEADEELDSRISWMRDDWDPAEHVEVCSDATGETAGYHEISGARDKLVELMRIGGTGGPRFRAQRMKLLKDVMDLPAGPDGKQNTFAPSQSGAPDYW